MKIYTKQGDKGTTKLYSGQTVSKGNLRVETYGTVDELTSHLGLAKSICQIREICNDITAIQEDLLLIATELATDFENDDPGFRKKSIKKLPKEYVKEMEKKIDHYQARSFQLKNFILPGLFQSSAQLDVCRTVCRRLERRLVQLDEQSPVRPEILAYINRLSDLLFAMARFYETECIIKNIVKELKIKVEDQPRGMEPFTEYRAVTLANAKRLLERGEKKAREIGVPMVMVVMDPGGNLIALHRMDGALLASIDIAQNKAFTAISLKMPTSDLGEISQPGKSLYGIQQTNQGRIVIFGGGFPLFHNQKLVGGIGVSGGSVAEDELVASAMIEEFQKEMV